MAILSCTVQSPWTKLLKKCLEARLDAGKFESLAKLLAEKGVTPPATELLRTALESQAMCNAGVDPLVPLYVEEMLRNRWVDECDVLRGLLDSFVNRAHRTLQGAPSINNGQKVSAHISPQLEEVLFMLAATNLSNQGKPNTANEAKTILKVLVDWMIAVTDSAHSAVRDDEEPNPETPVTRIALGTLIMTLLGNVKVRNLLDSPLGTGGTKNLIEPLMAFIPLLSQVSPQLAHRLEFEAHGLFANSYDRVNSEGLGVGDLQMNSMMDGPPMLSRASLVVYLEALLYSYPILDDHAFLTYLHVRYKGDTETLVTDLTTAAFDQVIIAASRGDPPNEQSVFRLFVVEKLPLLILSLFTMAFEPVDVSFVISQALSRIDPTSPLRQEFLLVCVAQGLLTDGNVENLTGSKPAQALQRHAKVSKEFLIQEYRKDSQQVDRFVARLGTFDGNSGSYAEAVVEILQHLCTTRDTMSLRNLCNSLACRPEALDAVALFVTPIRFLGPLCQLLDDWKYEEDQGEYQPVYDEFGACFLLLMACVDRFGLKSIDLGSINISGFIARVLDGRISSAPLAKELSQDHQRHLTGWIRGLFETEGISDELMSACPPQDFYNLISTIFRQSILACRSKVLELDKLKNGLELLLEPFLLPSIIIGIRSLVDYAWERGLVGTGSSVGHAGENSQDTEFLLQILKELISPSGKPSPMHSTVLSIVARTLESSLVEFQCLPPSKDDADRLLESLRPFLQGWRGSMRNIGKLTEFPASVESRPDITIMGFRLDFRELCSWSMTGLGLYNLSYSHKKLLKTLQLYGGPRLLQGLVEELKTLVQSPMVSERELALDLATTLVCSPYRLDSATPALTSAHTQPHQTLQTALHLSLPNLPTLSTSDSVAADVLSKLSRRVEAQLSSVPAAMNLTSSVPNLLDVNTGFEDLEVAVDPGAEAMSMNMDMTAVPSLQPEQAGTAPLPPDDVTGVGMSFQSVVGAEDGTFQLDIDAALAGQEAAQGYRDLPQSAEDDIFADMVFDTDMDFS